MLPKDASLILREVFIRLIQAIDAAGTGRDFFMYAFVI